MSQEERQFCFSADTPLTGERECVRMCERVCVSVCVSVCEIAKQTVCKMHGKLFAKLRVQSEVEAWF